MNHEQLKSLPLFNPARVIKGERRECGMGMGRPVLKFGDECNNGHNTFSITVDGGEQFGGCLHHEIRKFWPEYKHLIKWHLVSTDGPLHYLANTLYHADTKDCWGLEKGEEQPIKTGRTGKPVWKAVVIDGEGKAVDVRRNQWVNSDEKPDSDGDIQYVPVTRVGEGKEANLKAARSAAIAPTATLEQLQSREWLIERLPALMDEFAEAMKETFGVGMESAVK